MLPVLLEISGIKIYSYGFFIAVGYISALLIGRFLAKARGLNPAHFMDLAFIAIVTGVVGARLFFVLTNNQGITPSELLDFWNGGLVFYGGFICATLACLAYGKWRRMPIWVSTDIVVTGVALAHVFGRIGCFAAGCCHGSVCDLPWAMENHSGFVAQEMRGLPLHPVQLYEAFSLLLLAGFLAYVVARRKLKDGNPALIYLTGYAMIRFVMEFFRGDVERGFVLGGVFSTSQAIALALFLLGTGLFIFRLLQRRRKAATY
jgi:phosphatidylglycerol---prolipoprotein diacylglyceryl transferase